MKLTLETKLIPKESTVVVGVSGGRDSMALVHALIHQRSDLSVIVAHVNHNLRPDSNIDAEFVEGMMQRWEVSFESLSPRPPKDGNTEEWGREKRYDFFEKLLKKHKANFILTAHHQDDDFESMMLHFVRGTRVKGLSGMQVQRGNILRPLLFTSRAEINAYVATNDIPYRDDPSNEDNSLSRNFLRNKVIPVLNHVYPGLAERWQNQKPYWLELQAMLENSAELFLTEYLDKKNGLNRTAYARLPYPVRATALELWYGRSTGKRVADSATLERWDDALLNWDPRKKTEWDSTGKKGSKFLTLTKEWGKLV